MCDNSQIKVEPFGGQLSGSIYGPLPDPEETDLMAMGYRNSQFSGRLRVYLIVFEYMGRRLQFATESNDYHKAIGFWPAVESYIDAAMTIEDDNFDDGAAADDPWSINIEADCRRALFNLKELLGPVDFERLYQRWAGPETPESEQIRNDLCDLDWDFNALYDGRYPGDTGYAQRDNVWLWDGTIPEGAFGHPWVGEFPKHGPVLVTQEFIDETVKYRSKYRQDWPR